MPLSDLIEVEISLDRAAVIARGFGVPMILGQHTRFAERFREYTSPAEMLADGFVAADAEYKAALVLMSQDKTPELFVVGRRLAPVAQVVDITIDTVTNSVAYAVTLNGVVISINSDASALDTEIRDALIAAINADGTLSPKMTAATNGSNKVRVTSDIAGLPFTYSEADAKLSIAEITANVGIAEDLAAVRAAGAAWYGTDLTSRNVVEIELAGTWTEGNSADVPTLFLAQSSESAIKSAAYDAGTPPDVASKLRSLGYKRSALFFHSDDAEYLDAAVLGRLLPEEPGTETWALKDLAGVTVDEFSTTEKNRIVGASVGAGKNANIYYQLTAQNSITWRGQVANGEWIDVIRTIDWMKARMSERIVNVMLTNTKVPFDDGGIQLLAAQVSGVLQEAEDKGIIKKFPKYTVDAPLASEVSSLNRANRVLSPPITFGCELTGAIHEAKVSGKVTQ